MEDDARGSGPGGEAAGREAIEEERQRYRRLQILIAYTTATLQQDPSLTPEQGVELILQARRTAVSLFPGKEETFDLIYRPRLIRILEERFGSPPEGATGARR